MQHLTTGFTPVRACTFLQVHILDVFLLGLGMSAENSRKCAGSAIKKEKGRIRKQDSGMRILASRRVRYPWAMAPTINTTKLVATAIATLYLARSRSARPLPSRLYRPCRSSHSLHREEYRFEIQYSAQMVRQSRGLCEGVISDVMRGDWLSKNG